MQSIRHPDLLCSLLVVKHLPIGYAFVIMHQSPEMKLLLLSWGWYLFLNDKCRIALFINCSKHLVFSNFLWVKFHNALKLKDCLQ